MMKNLLKSITKTMICAALASGLAMPGLSGAEDAAVGHEGKVVTKMDAPSYTYMELEKDGVKTWIAAPEMAVSIGDYVKASQGIEMENFYGKALDRTFPSIFFVTFAEVAKKEEQTPHSAATPHQQGAMSEMKPKMAESPKAGEISKAKGGYTVAEILDGRKKLAGKNVTLHGKVVKASGKIMGRRWFHIQDGTASKAGVNDLVVTSQDKAEAGSTVTVTGILSLDKDFGMGYKYETILEDAAVSVE